MHFRPLLMVIPVLFGGCMLANRNYDDATFRKIGRRYLIEVSGKRRTASHDLQRWGTYEGFCQLDVPRIEGTIDGKEIHQAPGYYPFQGSISIHGREMIVNLKIDNYDFHRLDNFGWNGTYSLEEEKPRTARKRPPFGPYAALESITSNNGATARVTSFGTQPPFYPSYPERIRAAGEAGFVVVRIAGGKDGQVKSATVIQSSNKDFEERARLSASQMTLQDVSGDFSFDCRFRFSFLEIDEASQVESAPRPAH
jgi:TonB family protein